MSKYQIFIFNLNQYLDLIVLVLIQLQFGVVLELAAFDHSFVSLPVCPSWTRWSRCSPRFPRQITRQGRWSQRAGGRRRSGSWCFRLCFCRCHLLPGFVSIMLFSLNLHLDCCSSSSSGLSSKSLIRGLELGLVAQLAICWRSDASHCFSDRMCSFCTTSSMRFEPQICWPVRSTAFTSCQPKPAAKRPSACPLICQCLSQTGPIAEYNPST